MKREALSHPLAVLGVVTATASAVVFFALLIAMIAGLFPNPYAGLVVFIAIPAVFVLGLLLIPLGVSLRRRTLKRHPETVSDWPVIDFRRTSVRRTALVITALTAVNAIIVLLAGYGSLHWMESPQFCGQVCHTPMHPQFSAWQGGMHSRIACADCHISDGAEGFAYAKLSGVRQLWHVIRNSYPQPIAPGAHMPPGAQARICAGCHNPERIVGDRVKVFREYAEDETNSETMSALQMHLSVTTSSERAIHWHANPAVRVEYVATDAERQTIPYVKVTNAQGQVKEYVAPDTSEQTIRDGTRHVMDCVDCHNTVGHPISQTPERAIDQAIAAATVNRELPFARREGIRLVKADYPNQEAALRAIDEGLRQFYKSQAKTADDQTLARAVAALQDIYRRNVFSDMKVTFGSYPDNKGHMTSNGCFRCHDDSHAAKDGSTISADCEYCHKQLK